MSEYRFFKFLTFFCSYNFINKAYLNPLILSFQKRHNFNLANVQNKTKNQIAFFIFYSVNNQDVKRGTNQAELTSQLLLRLQMSKIISNNFKFQGAKNCKE